MVGTNFSAFDTSVGFTVVNNTAQIVYLQTSSSNFEKILAGATSTAQTAYYNYVLRNDNSTNGSIYLTIKVSSADGSLAVDPGSLKGNFVLTSNFA